MSWHGVTATAMPLSTSVKHAAVDVADGTWDRLLGIGTTARGHAMGTASAHGSMWLACFINPPPSVAPPPPPPLAPMVLRLLNGQRTLGMRDTTPNTLRCLDETPATWWRRLAISPKADLVVALKRLPALRTVVCVPSAAISAPFYVDFDGVVHVSPHCAGRIETLLLDGTGCIEERRLASIAAALPRLVTLSLRKAFSGRIARLSDFTTLTDLDLSETDVRSLGAMPPQLKRLNVSRCTFLDFRAEGTRQALASLCILEWLSVSCTTFDTSALPALQSSALTLRHLDVSGCTALTTLASIASFSNVTWLSIGDSSLLLRDADFEHLLTLRCLEELRMEGLEYLATRGYMPDLAQLRHLPALRILVLSRGTCVTSAQLEVIAALPHLTELHLDFTAVEDVSALRACPSLRILSLTGCYVTAANLECLAELTTLEELDVMHCITLHTVDCFAAYPALKWLGLGPIDVPRDVVLSTVDAVATLEAVSYHGDVIDISKWRRRVACEASRSC